MFVLCKARWAAIVYEMRYINKAALPCLMFLQRYFLCVSDRPSGGQFMVLQYYKTAFVCVIIQYIFFQFNISLLISWMNEWMKDGRNL